PVVDPTEGDVGGNQVVVPAVGRGQEPDVDSGAEQQGVAAGLPGEFQDDAAAAAGRAGPVGAEPVAGRHDGGTAEQLRLGVPVVPGRERQADAEAGRLSEDQV